MRDEMQEVRSDLERERGLSLGGDLQMVRDGATVLLCYLLLRTFRRPDFHLC